MKFRIADTFTDSLGKLTGDEQKAVKTTAFDLQLNPSNPGMQFHKLDRARDKNFWSVRVSRDIRIIAHKTSSSLLLCYVDHHDKAYAWAERRKLETHPKTGAAQLVEIREAVREIEVPRYVDSTPTSTKPTLFDAISDDQLLSYGVPEEWLEDARAATEDSLFALTDHLPKEAGEALLALAVGDTPAVDTSPEPDSPFEHPDAKRRFKLVTDSETLKQALDYPWEKWAVFLHPKQESVVHTRFNGPARVAGSAGTGKTIVALHRAAHLAKQHSNATVLVTTFTETLASVLDEKITHLAGQNTDVRDRITVADLNSFARKLYNEKIGPLNFADEKTIRTLLSELRESQPDLKLSDQFIWTEWRDVVDAWQLTDWDAYKSVPRLGRKTRLGEKQRESLWSIFSDLRAAIDSRGLITRPGMFNQLSSWLRANDNSPVDFVIVDEAQDLTVAQLRFLSELGSNRHDSLFFAGDLGQRIFEPPFSWKTLGVDIRGRSKTLRINYRTSHQIREQTDRLLPPELADVDGNSERRAGTVSLFSGPPPEIRIVETPDDEVKLVGDWISQQIAAGSTPRELGVFVRSKNEFPRAKAAIKNAGVKCHAIQDEVSFVDDQVTLMTMHKAKGLEFKSVVVMACDDEIIPLQQRMESVVDDSDLKEVYATERHLLYVACTRARDALLVTGVEPASEFLDDLVLQDH